MEISEKFIVTSRFAVGRNNNNFEKNIVVKLIYYLNIKSVNKKELLMRDYFFKVESVGGAIDYQVVDIQYKKKKIFFLNGAELYFIDFKKSLFDFN
ncbi:MAG: hypothetical protein ACN6N1_13115 [Acinetobacter guillouiae]|uniref:hypothetical protein n=1 Tax=Acinetobacter sp. 1125_18A TaxID=2605959 RepID=UPI003E095465